MGSGPGKHGAGCGAADGREVDVDGRSWPWCPALFWQKGGVSPVVVRVAVPWGPGGHGTGDSAEGGQGTWSSSEDLH